VEWDRFLKEMSSFWKGIDKETEKNLKSILDESNVGISYYRYAEFLKGFGPFEKCVENVKNVTQALWFGGYVSSTEAKRFLECEPDGTYLMRFSSSKPGAFVLDFSRVGSHGVHRIQSVLITWDEQGFRIKEGEQMKYFPTLQNLVDFYTRWKWLKTPFDSTVIHATWFHGDMDSEEASTLLQDHPPGTFLVRFSSTPGCFAISYVDSYGTVKKDLLTRAVPSSDGYCLNNSSQKFPDLHSFIAFYKSTGHFKYEYTS